MHFVLKKSCSVGGERRWRGEGEEGEGDGGSPKVTMQAILVIHFFGGGGGEKWRINSI